MSQAGIAVFIRPNWGDTVVNQRFKYLMDYLYWVGNNVISHASTTKLKVIDLQKEEANRLNVEKCIKESNPIFVFHTDHGKENMITGQNGCNIFCCDEDSGLLENHELLKNKIVYTLSCHSATTLGPAVIKKGGTSYIGYDSKLRICLLQGSDMDSAFEEIWSGGAELLIDGKTTKEAYTWVKERYTYWINYWEMRDHWAKATMLSSLKQDLAALKLLGQEDAKIV